MSLFKRKVEEPSQALPTEPVKYPDGVCVITESGRFYLSGSTKWKIPSEAVFESWSFPLVCKSSDVAISKYKSSIKPLTYRPSTVVRDVFSHELYIASTGGLVPLKDANVYHYLGLDDSKIIYASSSEINTHRKGAEL